MLFFTEMWERFSYYGMRALLVLYLVTALGQERAAALQVYAIYTGLVYITPILGGWLADRYLGARRAVLLGAGLMALGHFAMVFPALLHPALGLLVIGSGFFKPNISTLVGSLYGPQDPRRDSAFTIFYMGINLGAFLAPLVTGTLAAAYGWHYGFAAAGVGMLLGLAIFWRGQRWLGDAGLPPPRSGRIAETPLALTAAEWRRVLGLAIVSVFIIFFWMGFEQAGGTMNLFAEQHTEREILGWTFPAAWFQSVNPLFILLLAPLLSWIWTRWDASRFALPVTAKMAFGMLLLGLGFVVLALAETQAGQGLLGPGWLLGAYFLHTLGELFLSPIGLSMVSRVAPGRVLALMMGLWFAAMGVASYLAGTLESLLTRWDLPLYWFLVGTSVGTGLLLLLITPWLSRLMAGTR